MGVIQSSVNQFLTTGAAAIGLGRGFAKDRLKSMREITAAENTKAQESGRPGLSEADIAEARTGQGESTLRDVSKAQKTEEQIQKAIRTSRYLTPDPSDYEDYTGDMDVLPAEQGNSNMMVKGSQQLQQKQRFEEFKSSLLKPSGEHYTYWAEKEDK